MRWREAGPVVVVAVLQVVVVVVLPSLLQPAHAAWW